MGEGEGGDGYNETDPTPRWQDETLVRASQSERDRNDHAGEGAAVREAPYSPSRYGAPRPGTHQCREKRTPKTTNAAIHVRETGSGQTTWRYRAGPYTGMK